MKYGILKYERIRNLRIDNNLTQEEIADILGVKQNTYSQYEIGKINYPIDALPILAKFYKVSIDYMLDLTNETKPYPKK